MYYFFFVFVRIILQLTTFSYRYIESDGQGATINPALDPLSLLWAYHHVKRLSIVYLHGHESACFDRGSVDPASFRTQSTDPIQG